MNPKSEKTLSMKKLTLIIIVLILAAGFVGWWLGQKSPSQPNNASQSSNEDSDSSSGVKSLVSYALPDGWKEASCDASKGSVYIVPAGASEIDCNKDPSSPVKISVDPGNHTDCNELQNVQDVKKHICISLYINGHRSLKASTEYLASSSYKQATTINAYYIDTGKDVVKVEYIYNSDDRFQAGFDQLANSINAK